MNTVSHLGGETIMDIYFDDSMLNSLISSGFTDSSASLWGNGFIEVGNVNGNTDRLGYEFNSAAVTMGMDWKEADKIKGIFFSYGQTDVDYSESAGHTDQESYSVGGYYSFEHYDNQYFNLFGNLSYNQYDLARNINFASEVALADTHGYGIGFGFESGKPIIFNEYNLIPKFSADYSGLYLSGYSEYNAPGFNLQVDSNYTHTLSTELALEFNTEIKEYEDFTIVPGFEIGGRFNIPLDDRRHDERFAGSSQSATFTTQGDDDPIFSLIPNMYVAANYIPEDNYYTQAEFFIEYSPTISINNRVSHAGNVGLKLKF